MARKSVPVGINNSVSAIEGKDGVLTLSAWADDKWVYVRVADNGVGIPEKLKSKIFDPFFTTKKVGEGTGLGLSLCYGIINKYGGKIKLKSVSKVDHPDKPSGTSFTISMPISKEQS